MPYYIILKTSIKPKQNIVTEKHAVILHSKLTYSFYERTTFSILNNKFPIINLQKSDHFDGAHLLTKKNQLILSIS